MPTRPLLIRYEDDLALFPDMWNKIGVAVAILALVLFPILASEYWMTVGNMALIGIVGAVGMMILTGYTGQISLGHAAFLAMGAYTAAVLGHHYGIPFWLIIPLSGLIAALIGTLVGPFALRLEGLYLAVVTLGLLFLTKHTLVSMSSLTGGVKGIAVPMHWWFAKSGLSSVTPFTQTFQLGPLKLSFVHKLYWLFLALAVFSAWVAKNLQRTHTGRAMMAIRDHDMAAEAMGIHPSHAKIVAFGLSSFFAGIAGAMFAFAQRYITVDPPFNLAMSVKYIAIIVLGGVGTVFGAVAGAIVYTFLAPLAEWIGHYIPYLKELSSHNKEVVLFSIVICGFLIFEPLGLFGIWLRIKRYFLAWPFRY